MRLLSLLLLIVVCTPTTPGRADSRAEMLERLTKDVKYLASDELEGRGAGTKGLQTAAEYVRDEFQRLGLKSGTEDGTYFQAFPLRYGSRIGGGNAVTLRGPNGQVLELQQGKQFQPIVAGGKGQVNAPVVFVGYGIRFANPHDEKADPVYDDFAGVDVKGKVVVVIRREPQQEDEKSLFDGKKTTTHSYIRTKMKQAKDHGAAAVLFVNDPTTTAKEMKDTLSRPTAFGYADADLPFVHVTQETINTMLASAPVKAGDAELADLVAIESRIDADLKPVSQPLEGWTADITTNFSRLVDTVENVIGVIEGETDEVVIIGAHYDHLGFGPYGSRASGENARKLHNGADDNATGTAAIMEIARRFSSTGTKPRRTLVFIAFAGEELGLIGSAYYVKNPTVPLEKVAAMINFDMIGRLRNDKLTVMGVGTSPGFGKLLDRLNEDHGFKLAKQNGGSGGSDQASFVGKKIPVMFFFTGTTREYHTPADDFETLNMPGLQRVTEYAGDVVAEIVAADERPPFGSGGGGGGRGSMAYLGVKPDYTADVLGLKLNGTTPGSPADKAGFKEGDIIVQFGTVPVGDIAGLAEALRKYKPGQKVEVTVERGEEKVKVEVTLGEPMNLGG